ncbi:unnamed protein product, partial [Polarella glacialis]
LQFAMAPQTAAKAAVPQVPAAPLRPKPVRAEPPAPRLCSKAFPCKICSQEFDTEHAMNLHVKYIHQSKED